MRGREEPRVVEVVEQQQLRSLEPPQGISRQDREDTASPPDDIIELYFERIGVPRELVRCPETV